MQTDKRTLGQFVRPPNFGRQSTKASLMEARTGNDAAVTLHFTLVPASLVFARPEVPRHTHTRAPNNPAPNSCQTQSARTRPYPGPNTSIFVVKE